MVKQTGYMWANWRNIRPREINTIAASNFSLNRLNLFRFAQYKTVKGSGTPLQGIIAAIKYSTIHCKLDQTWA